MQRPPCYDFRMKNVLLSAAILSLVLFACTTQEVENDERIIVTGKRIPHQINETDITLLTFNGSLDPTVEELADFIPYAPENSTHEEAVTGALSAYLDHLPEVTRGQICRLRGDNRPAVKSLVPKKCHPSRSAQNRTVSEEGAILLDKDLVLLPSISLSPTLDEAAFLARVPGCTTLIDLFEKRDVGWAHKKDLSVQFIEIGLCDERW